MKARQTKQYSLFMRPAGAALATFLYGGAAVAQVANITPIVVPNSASVSVSALNQQGNVAGYFTDATGVQRAFFWNGVSLDQGTLGGSTALALDLNDFDQTTGYAYAVGDASFRAFLGAGQTLLDLGTIGGSSSLGRAVNNAGAVTGYSFVSLTSANFHAFISRRGAVTDLGTLGGATSAGMDINDSGQVAGDSDLTGGLAYHGFFYDGAVMHDVGTLGGAFSSVTDLNNHGQVTGSAGTATGEDHAFLFGGGTIRDLGTLGGPYSIGYAVNDAGVVAGDSSLPGDVDIQGFVWSAGVLTSVGHLGGQFSTVWGMNNSNEVVGVSSDAQGLSRAYVWKDGAIVDLNSTLPAGSGWVLDAAYYINDAGQIVGTGLFQGQPSWYRLELVSVQNQPPVARAGADSVVECGTPAALDGSGSSDPDGDALSFAWLRGDQLLGETARLSVGLESGVHSLRLRVTDSNGASAEDEVVVTVRDSRGPAVLCPEGRTASANDDGVAAVPDYLATLLVTDECTPAGQFEKRQEPAAGTLVRCGVHAVTLRVVDRAGNVTTCDSSFTVVDTTAPRVEVPGSVTQAVGGNCSAVVPDLLREVHATDNCTPHEQLVLTQQPAAGTAVGVGEHAIAIRVVDAAGNATVKSVTLRVVDQTAPVILSVTATPDVIRPANKQMVPVSITVVSADQCDPSPVRRIVSVESSDPEAQADRATSPDWIVTGDLTLEVRAEVTVHDFRVYTVVVSSTDRSGNSSTSTVQVLVQKNKSSGGGAGAVAVAGDKAKGKK